MKTISLLPPQIKQQRRIRRHRVLLLLAGALMLVLFIFINIVFALALGNVKKETAQVERHRALVQQEIELLQEYRVMQERADAVELVLEEALGTEPDWHNLLYNLALDFPTGLQLKGISAGYAEDAGELFMYGSAQDPKMALDWIEKLEAMPQLGEIEYPYTTLNRGPEGLSSIDFQITASLQPGKPAGGRKEMLDLD